MSFITKYRPEIEISEERIDDALNKLKMFKLVTCGAHVLPTIKHTKRSNNAGRLDFPIVEGKAMCKWCGKNPIKGNRHYCSDECQQSCYMSLGPQGYDAKGFLLIRQDLKCASCGYSWRELIAKKLKYWISKNISITFWQIGTSVKNAESFEFRRCDADHIIPIHRDGDVFGLDNMQALCYDCHMEKTIREKKNIAN